MDGRRCKLTNGATGRIIGGTNLKPEWDHPTQYDNLYIVELDQQYTGYIGADDSKMFISLVVVHRDNFAEVTNETHI